MKATLEFDLVAERDDFEFAWSGCLFHAAFRSFDEWLRRSIKDESDPARAESLQAVRSALWEQMDAQGITRFFA